MSKSKTNLITAITISGKLTIAHYLFVLKPILAIKKNYNFFFSIADLHAITTKHVSNELIKLRQQTANYLFACGFPSNEIFVQSQISGHSKMAFILGCHTNIGTLLRMTQFKSKKNRNFQNLALLNYPLLMASDILLYDADVWVGNDQKQHVELTRDLAQKINNSFHQKIFYQPNLINNSFFNYRIRDLQKPTVKMSKSSQDPRGIIFFHDNSEIIKDKIIACKTDSENKIIFDFEKKPGIHHVKEHYNRKNCFDFTKKMFQLFYFKTNGCGVNYWNNHTNSKKCSKLSGWF